MKKMLSINYSTGAFNVAMLLLRVGAGVLMLPHGYDKLVKFASLKGHFIDFLGMGSTLSLSLAIFAEFFCSMFLIIGLFTRLVTIPLIITMAVAVSVVNNYDFFGKGELATLFLVAFAVILLVGPGKASVDGLVNN